MSGIRRDENAYRLPSFMAPLNLYVRTTIRVATFDANHSVTDSTQAVHNLPDSAVQSVSTARHRRSMCQTERSVYQSV